MKKSFKLSETELQIMDILWQLPEPSSLKEIMDFLNERLNKSWKQQTVGTYLSHLEKAGLVNVDKRFARLLYSCRQRTQRALSQMTTAQTAFSPKWAHFCDPGHPSRPNGLTLCLNGYEHIDERLNVRYN